MKNKRKETPKEAMARHCIELELMKEILDSNETNGEKDDEYKKETSKNNN